MNIINNLKCNCGKEHKCSIKKVIIENDAISKSISLFNNYKNILIIADNNTYDAYKNKLESILNLNANILVINRKGILIPNEIAISEIENKLTKETDLIIGVGSGVINDLCKYVSFKHKLPYYIIASAPSMDGYASNVAALIINNMKITYPAHVPEAIIADVSVIANSPEHMIKAGIGDIIGKLSALNDWKLSNLINNEYICLSIYNLVNDYVNKVIDNLDNIVKRNNAGIKLLMESLISVGIAMSYVGSSRPASGSEHHIAHYFEIVGIIRNEKYLSHGLDVLYGTYLTSKIRENILNNKSYPLFDTKNWKNDVEETYNQIATDVIKLQNKAGWVKKDLEYLFTKNIDSIKNILNESPKPIYIEQIMNRLGLDANYYEKYYGNKKIEESIKYSKYLKDRFTILWFL